MRTPALLLLIVHLLTGCKAWDAALVSVKKEPISPQLPAMDKKIEDIGNTTVYISEDETRLFTKEVEENLTNPFGDKYGHIIMKLTVIHSTDGMGWLVPNFCTLYFGTLFGMPVAEFRHKLEVEFRIIDSKDKMIAKYSGIGKGSALVALYHGYAFRKAPRKSFTQAMNEAMDQIRPQIQRDAVSLNEKLIAAGKQ